MIISAFMALGATILNLFAMVFSAFNFIIPDVILSSLYQAVSYVRLFNGLLPIDDFIQAFTTLMTFYGVYYSYKLVLWLYSALPFIGRGIKHNDD